MKKIGHIKREGYSICVPQKAKVDAGIIGKLQCQLMCRVDKTVVHVSYASEYLIRGKTIVDANGDLVTSLDNDLEKKLVIVSSDLNLWYALLQSAVKDEEVNIETIAGRYMKF